MLFLDKFFGFVDKKQYHSRWQSIRNYEYKHLIRKYYNKKHKMKTEYAGYDRKDVEFYLRLKQIFHKLNIMEER
jgi:hypothetical protein